MGSQPTKPASPIIQQIENNEKKFQKNDKIIEIEDSEEEEEIEDNDNEINYEDFIVIWLDENPIDYRLKSINAFTRSFTDSKKCLEYIKSIKNEFIFLIIGRTTLARPFIQLKTECNQLKMIYIHCTRQPELTNQWKDAKTFLDIPSLIEILENDLKQMNNNIIKIRIIKENEDLSFIWHFLFLQLLNEINSPINTQKQKLFEQLKNFYRNNKKQIKLIEAFQKNYRSKYSLWWLTFEHKFLLQTLNKALRIKDYSFLCAYRFYLKDLYNQIIELKPNIIFNNIIVYFTQKNFLKDITKYSKNNLILIETFLFTTINYPQTNDIIIEINIKEQTSQLYAQLNEHGDMIFYPMTVFRLDYFKDKFIRLIIDQQTDIKIHQMIDNAIEKYSLEPHNPIKMGLALWKLNIGNIQQAYSYHTMLIDHLPPKNCLDLANLHNNLAGILKDNQSYRRALIHYEIAERLYLKSVSHNHLYLTPTYTNMGNVYRLKGKHSQSLEYHLKALNIREKILPLNHIEIGQSLMEVALCYHDLELNYRAIPLLNRAKDIFEYNKISKDDSKFIQLEEAFIVCQED